MGDQLHEHVGIECGTAEGQEVIGIMYPIASVVETENPECDTRYMTLPCAKALLIDLRDAIAECEKHQA